MRKKRFKQVFYFGLVLFSMLFVLHFVLQFGIKSIRIDQIGKINAIAAHDIDPEIAIFGSSVSEVGISPDEIQKSTGLSCFNFSLNGTSFYQYRGLIDEFTTHSKVNKVVVFAEAYFSFSKRDALMAPDHYLAQLSNDRIRLPLEQIDPDLILKSRYIPFYRFIAASHIYYKYAAKGIINKLKGTKDQPILNGFTPVDRSWEADADQAIKQAGKFDIEIDRTVLRLYIQQIKRIQNKGLKVIIILTPIYKKALAKATSLKPLYAAMNEISQKTGAKFLDFSNSDLAEQKTMFYNSNHLNLKGALLFSKQLGDSIRQLNMNWGIK
jgi:hypothetical protein